MNNKQPTKFEKASNAISKAVGTPVSLIVHTIFFVAVLSLWFLGMKFDTVLLLLTSLLSIEAIYIGIFNQILNNAIVEQSPDIEI